MNKQIPLGLRGKMLLFFGGGVVVLIIAINLVSLYGIPFLGIKGEYTLHVEDINRKLSDIADLKKEELSHWFRERLLHIRTVSEDNYVGTGIYSLLRKFREGKLRGMGDKEIFSEIKKQEVYGNVLKELKHLKEIYPDYEDIDVIDLSTGSVVMSTNEKELGMDFSSDEAIIKAKLPGVREQIYFRKRADGQVMLNIFNQVNIENPPASSVILFKINFARIFGPLLHAAAALGRSGEIILMDMNRTLLAPLKYPLSGNQRAVPLEYKLMTKPAELAAWGIDGTVSVNDYRGVPVIAAVRHARITSEFGIGMIVKQDRADIFSHIREGLIFHFSVSAAGLILLIAVIHLIAQRISRPILELGGTAQKIMNGDLGARCSVQTADEVGEMARSFNKMVEKIQGWNKELEDKVMEKTAELSESEERVRLALMAANQGLYDLNLQSGETIVNSEYAVMLGYDPAEFHETNAGWIERLHPEDREKTASVYRAYIKGEIPLYRVEFRQRTRSGDWKWILSIGRIVERDREGRPLRMLGTHTDITERKKAERELMDVISFNEKIFSTSPVGIITYDSTGRCVSANERAGEIIGASREQVLQQNFRSIESWKQSGLIEEAEKTLAAGRATQRAVHMTTTFGRDVYIDCRFARFISGGQAHLLLIFIDITERRKLEDQLLHAQKMEAVGTLAGGIAHDFNNILMAIMGYGHLLLMKMGTSDPLRTNVETILSSAERAANLTQSLLAFSRKQLTDLRPVDVNEIIRSVEKLLLRVIGEHISLRTVLTDSKLTVMADGIQIEQVLMNLATNARDAMPEGGVLTISTEEIGPGEDIIKLHGLGEALKYVLISVADTGSGIDQATAQRIFEPFFTTKEVGKGTGLGLAMAYGIIKQHEGYVDVYSEPGTGTTFRIYLPLVTAKPAESVMTGGPPSIQHGNETLLMAEDNEDVRKISRMVLEDYGYKVIEAVDGADAVRKFMENNASIDLLLFDAVMPKMSGKTAYEKIREVRPDIKAIFISGYAADFTGKVFTSDKWPIYLSKPIQPAALLKRVREALDTPR